MQPLTLQPSGLTALSPLSEKEHIDFPFYKIFA